MQKLYFYIDEPQMDQVPGPNYNTINRYINIMKYVNIYTSFSFY